MFIWPIITVLGFYFTPSCAQTDTKSCLLIHEKRYNLPHPGAPYFTTWSPTAESSHYCLEVLTIRRPVGLPHPCLLGVRVCVHVTNSYFVHNLFASSSRRPNAGNVVAHKLLAISATLLRTRSFCRPKRRLPRCAKNTCAGVPATSSTCTSAHLLRSGEAVEHGARSPNVPIP